MGECSVIDVLQRGQEWTDELKALLVQLKLPSDQVEPLLGNISGAFSEAIAMSQNIVASPDQTLPSTDENDMDTISSKKRRTQATPKFGGRKRANNSCNKVLSKSIDDEYQWRKYGQKEIFGAKYPRSYFRCTHKNDQNCQATRQVQQSEKQPDMYEITYIGEHTCKEAKKHCQKQEASYMINFNPNTNNALIQHFSSPPLSSIKHEQEEEVMSNQTSPGSIISHEQVNIPSEFLDMEPIASDSFSMDFDGSSLELENISSIFSFDQQYCSLFQV
ncbi:WRKY DNA-binding protein 70 [Rhynchospora pubera]|uniref:WRKY DNA-binding protein 70 n=1 Tax=Rhynchospora pubera TaxID=906938 RepID=A0AAV8DTH2_9POAL|nr:WRKY DNA-binding protein 70 [Rhynchospora pubera]